MAAQDDTPALGVQLSEAIRERRLTPTAVAKRAGLGKSYVSKIIHGQVVRPGEANLRKLEKALGLRSGHFKIPPQRETTASLQEVLDRLAELSEMVAELSKGQKALLRRIPTRLEAPQTRAATGTKPPR